MVRGEAVGKKLCAARRCGRPKCALSSYPTIASSGRAITGTQPPPNAPAKMSFPQRKLFMNQYTSSPTLASRTASHGRSGTCSCSTCNRKQPAHVRHEQGRADRSTSWHRTPRLGWYPRPPSDFVRHLVGFAVFALEELVGFGVVEEPFRLGIEVDAAAELARDLG